MPTVNAIAKLHCEGAEGRWKERMDIHMYKGSVALPSTRSSEAEGGGTLWRVGHHSHCVLGEQRLW